MSLQIVIRTGPHSYDCSWDDVKVEANVTRFSLEVETLPALLPRVGAWQNVRERYHLVPGWYIRVKL
jgi:hypothetical protein